MGTYDDGPDYARRNRLFTRYTLWPGLAAVVIGVILRLTLPPLEIKHLSWWLGRGGIGGQVIGLGMILVCASSLALILPPLRVWLGKTGAPDERDASIQQRASDRMFELLLLALAVCAVILLGVHQDLLANVLGAFWFSALIGQQIMIAYLERKQ